MFPLHCLAVAALLAGLASAPQAKIQEPAPPRIAEIRLQGNQRVADETFWDVIESRPGDVYQQERIRSDFRKLSATGLFSDLQVVQTIGKDGIRITFKVAERPLIKRLDFPGLRSLSRQEAEAAFQAQGLILMPGEPFDPFQARKGADLLGRLLQKKGRPLARVKVKKKKAGPGAVSLKMRVKEGPQALLTEIRFEGNSVFSQQQLAAMLHLHELPAVYLEERLETDLKANILSRYKSLGYILAAAGAPRLELHKSRGKAYQSVTVPIEEGPQFRFGRLRFEGFQALSPQQLDELFRFEPGQPVDLTALREATDELDRSYRRLGYLDFETDASVDPDLQKRTVDITIRAREGSPYRVGSVEVLGAPPEDDPAIRQALGIEPLTVFNPELLQLSIARLDRLGLFQEIGPDDWQVGKDEELGQVHITIRLKPRGR